MNARHFLAAQGPGWEQSPFYSEEATRSAPQAPPSVGADSSCCQGLGAGGGGWRMWGDSGSEARRGPGPQPPQCSDNNGDQGPQGPPRAQARSKQPAAPSGAPGRPTSRGRPAAVEGRQQPHPLVWGSPGSPLISAPHALEEGGAHTLSWSGKLLEVGGLPCLRSSSNLALPYSRGRVRRPQDSSQAQPQRSDPPAKVTGQGHQRSQETPKAAMLGSPGQGRALQSLLPHPLGCSASGRGVSRPPARWD